MSLHPNTLCADSRSITIPLKHTPNKNAQLIVRCKYSVLHNHRLSRLRFAQSATAWSSKIEDMMLSVCIAEMHAFVRHGLEAAAGGGRSAADSLGCCSLVRFMDEFSPISVLVGRRCALCNARQTKL
jgi:hypothetical protein